ncbi:Hpt domain-containing protein [Thalassospiraceae bacterium LMO-JJ14]|nr:Hpt domain-containing protein [Thalassospiraceae bacterium LMO-JJ14]
MADDEMEIINPPNTLKSKVREGGPGAVDLATLERAENVIAGMADSYLEWVQEDLVRIEAAYKKLAAAAAPRKEEADMVFQVAHDIKGQGGSFGYDLMTLIANELCRLIERQEEFGDAEVQAVKVHIDAMKLVIQNRMKGDGGTNGQALVEGIRQVGDKLNK